jgi:hypothetical protein
MRGDTMVPLGLRAAEITARQTSPPSRPADPAYPPALYG